MRRLVFFVALTVLAGGACSNDDDSGEKAFDDGNLGSVATAVDPDSPGIEKGDVLVDAAVAADGVLYLALRDAKGGHRLLSLRDGRPPRVLTDGAHMEGFVPTAVATDSGLRSVFVAAGEWVFELEDFHNTYSERKLVRRTVEAPPGPSLSGAPTPTAQLSAIRYMAYDGRGGFLYMADTCRVVRYRRRYEVETVAEVAGAPGTDCAGNAAAISGLAVDQRTGEVYVSRGRDLVRVGEGGRLTPVEAREDDSGSPARPVTGHALAVNALGEVLIAGSGSGGVDRLKGDGVLDRVRGVEHPETESHNGVPSSRLVLYGEDWIGVDGAGNLYAARRNLDKDVTPSPVRVRKVVAGAISP